MDGLVEELLRFENAKHEALVGSTPPRTKPAYASRCVFLRLPVMSIRSSPIVSVFCLSPD